jgi:hypothetical protein
MPSRRPIHRLALAALVVMAIGCQSDPRNQDLRVNEYDRFTPSGRVSYEIYPGIERRRAGTLIDLVTGPKQEQRQPEQDPEQQKNVEPVTARSAGIKGTISLDGEIAAVDAQDHQQIAAGEQVEMGDVIIPGPTRLRVKMENLRGYVAVRGGVRFYDVLTVEGITGLGIDRTRVRIRGGATRTGDTDLEEGLLLGMRATLRPIALFDIYYQLTANIVHDLFSDSDPIEDEQVGLELNLTRNVSLYGGYRWWRYVEKHASMSDIHLKVRGPNAGLSLKF